MKKLNIKIFGVLISIILLSTIFPVSGEFTINKENNLSTNETNAKWTLFYYNCCDRNHTSYENQQLIDQLKTIGSTNDLNIVAMVDGEYDDDTEIYYFEQDNAIRINEYLGWPSEANLSDPVVLKEYITNVITAYPAENYAMIILSDMGSSWQGILHDDDAPLMSIPDFADVFEEITVETGEKIDILGLRPCAMGGIEVAYELRNGVGYLVASEDHLLEPLDKGPDYIFQYYAATWYLKNNTDISPEEFAEKMVELFNPTDFPLYVLYVYEVIYKKGDIRPIVKTISNLLTKFFNKLPNSDYHTTRIDTTLSTTNLSRINSVAEKIDILSQKLILYSCDEDTINSVKYARENVREYAKMYSNGKNKLTTQLALIFSIGKFSCDNFIDLIDLVKMINETSTNPVIKNACQDVIDEFNKAILANARNSYDPSYGLHIYFPEEKYQYNKYLWSTEMPCLYEELDFSKDTHWDEFVKTFLKI